MLGDEQRLEAAVAVARHLDAQRPVLGQHRLAAGAVAVVGRLLGLGRAGRVAQVVRQLGAQRTLDQRLLERHRTSLTASALMGPVTNWSISSLGIDGNAAVGRGLLRSCLA